MKVNFFKRSRVLGESSGIAATALSMAASAAVGAFSIFAGRGSHDLVWMVNLAIFTLANLRVNKGWRMPSFLAAWMIALFAGAGWAEIYGILKNPYGTDPGYILFHSLSFAVIMAVTTAVIRRRHALLQAEVEEKNAQIKANDELREANRRLETQAEERAQELSKVSERIKEQAARLRTVSEISQEIAAAEGELQPLLRHIVGTIGTKLNYDHVGLFLLNESRQYAVLRAASSEGGKRMLERRHQLRVGGAGIVGYVSQSGLPRIALDTGRDAVFFNNPDLPQTRSEMALPLKYGSRVVGVLDIQSNQPSAFKEEDASLLGALANQIALAIYAASGEAERDKSPARQRWMGRKKQVGYAYSAEGTTTAATAADSPLVQNAVSSGETVLRSSKDAPAVMAVPVKFRDQVIGVIQVEATEQERAWAENEIALVQAIAERAAFALENARLFEETTRRAEQEQAIARVASQIGSSTDFDRILQITVEELGRTLGAARAFIQLEPPVRETDRLSQPGTD